MALPSDTQKKVDRSIRLLQSAQAGYDGVFELAYSGGKDSDVILQLAKEAGIRYRAIYKNTTIDYPGTLRHVKEMRAEIIMPKMKFFDIVAQMGLPNRMKRFCCGILKEYRYDTSLKKMITGVRRSEGNDRAKRYTEPTQCRGTKKDPYEAIYPILDWTDDDILAFILDRNLKLAPVYYDSGGVLTSNSVSAAWVAPCFRSSVAKLPSKLIRNSPSAICAPPRDTGTVTPILKSESTMPTYMSGSPVTSSIRQTPYGKNISSPSLGQRTTSKPSNPTLG